MKDIEKDLQTQITINAGQIDLRVRKDSVIFSINMSPETITLQAQRIDLQGLVNAQELITKFATIATLNATAANLNSAIIQKANITDLNAANARIDNLEINKLSVGDFNAQNISAMNITVKSANVTGGFDASKITSGTISAERIDASTIVSKIGEFSGSINVTDLYVNDYLGAKRITTNYIEASQIAIGIGSEPLSKKAVVIDGVAIYYVA